MQRRAAPDFRRANEAYLRLSRGKRAGRRQIQELERGERSIRAARSALGAVRPPDDAADLHAALLRAFEVNAGLARETTELGRYVPAAAKAFRPLQDAGDALGPALARPGDAQRAAALDRYATELGRAGARLGRLSPPPVLARSHREQVLELARTRRLARGLETAIESRDSEGAARLLLAFRRERRPGGPSRLARRSLAAYGERRREVLKVAGEVARQRMELERTLEDE